MRTFIMSSVGSVRGTWSVCSKCLLLSSCLQTRNPTLRDANLPKVTGVGSRICTRVPLTHAPQQ